MTESEVVKAIRKQREEIARNELDTLRRMARLWVPSYRYLQEQVSALMRIIQDKRDKGEAVEIEYIHSLKRYQTMMEQAAVTIRKYNKAIAGLINGAEAEATGLGQSNASSVISIAEPDHELWTRVNRRETTIAAGMTAEGSPLDSLLEKSFGQMKEGMEQALITGISTGQGSAWITDQIMQAAQIPERRALLIARTEINRAYRQSNWNQMRSSRAVLGYRRMCYPDTACFACLMLDKEFYPIDSEPCDHPNGKCSFVPVTRHYDPGNDPNWERGQDWFARQDEATKRKLMGPGRFEAWKAGEIQDPRDLVRIKPNNVWGGSPTMISMKELNLATATERRMFHEYTETMGDYLPTKYLYDFVSVKHAGGIDWDRIQYDHNFIKIHGADKSNPPLTNIESAFEINKKLSTYALSLTHETGKHKALVFERALGFTLENADLLESQIRDRLSDFRATDKGISQYGHKFEVKLLIDGPNGNRQPIISSWQYDNGSENPRMVTVYVDKNQRP